MAKQLNYTDSFGENYPTSYWRPGQIVLNKEKRTADVAFFGFADITKKGKRIIAQKVYSISGNKYDQYFAAGVIDPLNIDHLSQSYKLADETLDMAGKSFFDGAIDV